MRQTAALIQSLVITVAIFWTAPVIAQEPYNAVRAQIGDWQIVCNDPLAKQAKETCAMVQSVTDEDQSNIGLTVYFMKHDNGKSELRVFAPVGVLLVPGLGLKIDDADVGHAAYERCYPFACYAKIEAPAQLVDSLSRGKTAVFIISQNEKTAIGIPISLTGFQEALTMLKNGSFR